MCGKNLLCGFLFLAACLSLSGQSFDPSAVYEIQGAWLNERQAESKIANEALKNSLAENEALKLKIKELSEKLALDLVDRGAILTEVSKQLTEASTLLKRLRDEALSREIVIGVVAAGVGFLSAQGVK